MQRCLGSEEPIVPSHAWQNDVKASVNNTWQISPFCHMLLVGAFVLDGSNSYHEESFCVSSDNQNAESWKTSHRHRKREWMPKYHNGPISHNDEPQAGQMNFAQDSIEELHRRVLSGHMVIPEPVVQVRRTQNNAAKPSQPPWNVPADESYRKNVSRSLREDVQKFAYCAAEKPF